MMGTNNGKKRRWEEEVEEEEKNRNGKIDVHMLNVAFMLWYVCGGLRRYVCVCVI